MHLYPNPDAAVFESVGVFRLSNITISCVMFDGDGSGGYNEHYPADLRGHIGKKAVLEKVLDGEQRSLTSSSFIASDMEMHKFPPKTDLISADMTQCFSFDTNEEGKSMFTLRSLEGHTFHVCGIEAVRTTLCMGLFFYFLSRRTFRA